MIEAWAAADVRAAEKPLLDAGVPLMDRAAFALAQAAAQEIETGAGASGEPGRRVALPGSRVALLVGAGNNGGDALFAGAYLARRGVEVTAVCTSEHPHADGLAALLAAGGRCVDASSGRPMAGIAGWWAEVLAEVRRADVVLDGLVGIGAVGPLRGPGRDLVEDVGAHPCVVAVDAPSGIGVDDGAVAGPVLAARRTVTFGAAKPGLLLPPAAYLAGTVTVIDIGLDLPDEPAVRRLEPADVARDWPVPGPTDHKYTRGVVGVVAGTARYPGAAVLATTGAVRTGAGMVRYRGPKRVTDAVLAARPEVVPGDGRVQAWVLGPGLPADGPDDGQGKLARSVLDGPAQPAVVDAGALGHLPQRVAPTAVLTPHAGELAGLLAALGEPVERWDIEAEPLRWAVRAYELTGATVLLKGAVSVIVGPGSDGRQVVFAQPDGPGWLATAGSGDVLAGILGAILAARADELIVDDAPEAAPVARPVQTPAPGHAAAPATSRPSAAELAATAVFVHGRAGTIVSDGGPVAALDLADAVPFAIANLLAG